ncbi:hypothetical protein AZE42_05995 [Rhizopogon vesiculosus]|uniref:Pentacotripeptide-repeat region of PRORP domain-containing protein n=1 Tax=Rhizopogon vesiculosus TaxID=180088 RepID=A0A1J8R0E9_9AGAM|nr:hypothetical protein AZE42_05995 [Rhizopogon vesiculosus]
MLAGPTSSLRFSPTLSQVPCWLRQVQQLFARRQATSYTFQVHRRIHAVHMMKERAVGEESCTAKERKADEVQLVRNTALADHSNAAAHQIRVVKPFGQDGVIPRAPLPPLDGSPDVETIHSRAGVGSPRGQQNPEQLHAYPHPTSHRDPMDSFEETPPERMKKRQKLLDYLLQATSVTEGWEAYHTLTVMFPHHIHHLAGVPKIPQRHLHHLARLLASTKPRTRTLFLRLSAVLTTLHRSGGRIYLWEWNALLDCAGKRWRKCSLEDYKAAVEVFSTMTTTPQPSENTGGDGILAADPDFGRVQPDIITYTTLLYIAGRSLDPSAIRHASNLLRASGLPPNRITHLSLLYYYTRTKQLSGVRSTLQKMGEQGFEPGLDGINACIWAYARNGHMDIASTIYRVLRHNLQPELDVGDNDIEAAVKYLLDVESIPVPSKLIPDEITYTALIQSFAYHGQFMKALHVFVDMLSTPNRESKAPMDQTGEPLFYQPTLAAFRGLFLGFARHAQKPLSLKAPPGSLSERLFPSQKSDWNLDNLHQVFKAFISLPADTKPSERLIYWILVSFGKASGDDPGKLRKVFLQLEQRFGGGWGGRLERLRESLFGENGSGGR